MPFCFNVFCLFVVWMGVRCFLVTEKSADEKIRLRHAGSGLNSQPGTKRLTTTHCSQLLLTGLLHPTELRGRVGFC